MLWKKMFVNIIMNIGYSTDKHWNGNTDVLIVETVMFSATYWLDLLYIGFVNDILSWGGFRPLATLSYNVYLCHMGLQMISLARIRQPLDFDMFMLVN